MVKMKLFSTFLITSCAIVAALILSYSGGGNVESFLLMFIACLFTFASVALLHREFKLRIEYRCMLDEFMKCFEIISYYRSSNVPLPNSIRSAAKCSMNKKVSNILFCTASRIELGEEFFDALKSALSEDKRLSDTLSKYLRGSDFTIEEMLSLYELNKRESASVASSLAVRYSTCNMFISTVAPAFIMFSFVGSMLISQGSPNMELMSLGMASAIPIAYSISSSVASRRFVG